MKTYKKSPKSQKESIEVNEEFMPYGTKQLDSKDRITLGGKLKKILGDKMAVEGFQVFVGKDGDILLRPSVSIPAREAWVFKNPEVIGAIRQGIEDAKAGRLIRVDDLKDFLKKL
jgi:hypothetical protein